MTNRVLFLEDAPLAKYGIGLAMEQQGIIVKYTRLCDKLYDGDTECLKNTIHEFKPDFIFNMGMCCFKNRESLFGVLKEENVPYIYWAIEDPVDTWLSLDHAKHAAFTFTTAMECIPFYKRNNIAVKLMTFGCNMSFHKSGHFDSQFNHDIIFVGNNYFRHSARDYGLKTILKPLMDRNYDIKVYGNDWWFLPGGSFNLERKFYGGYMKYENFSDACASAKIVLGIHSVNNSSTMMSMRTFEVLGCKGFYLTQYVPAVEKYFENGVHLVWSKTSFETLKLVDKYLNNEKLRKQIAENGQKECYLKHEYGNKVKSMFTELKTRGIIC